MSEPVFLRHSLGLTLAEIASVTGASAPPGASERRLTGIAALDRASPDELSFFDRGAHAGAARDTNAGACLTTAASPFHWRVGSHIDPFEASSVLACAAARMAR